jgi:hypothetical protein
MGDLLERLLDRGVFVKIDLIISVAGIPLIGLSLHAALASIETMTRYGMFGDWDKSTRAQALLERGPAQLALAVGENTVVEQFAMLRTHEGIIRAWRPGRAYLTNQRLLLVRRSPNEVLVSLALCDVVAIGSFDIVEAGVTSEVLCLADASGALVLVRTGEPEIFRAVLADLLSRAGVRVNQIDSAELRVAFPDVSAESQLWHDSGAEGGWRPGWGAISNGFFSFWSDFERRRVVEVDVTKLEHVNVERRFISAPLGDCEVLSLVRRKDHRELAFVGKDVQQWAIRKAMSTVGSDDSLLMLTETTCGRDCSGWYSPWSRSCKRSSPILPWSASSGEA